MGLMMMNEPAYIATWMACGRIGVVVAMLNYNLRLKVLLHCIDIAEIKVLVIGNDKSLIEVSKYYHNHAICKR